MSALKLTQHRPCPPGRRGQRRPPEAGPRLGDRARPARRKALVEAQALVPYGQWESAGRHLQGLSPLGQAVDAAVPSGTIAGATHFDRRVRTDAAGALGALATRRIQNRRRPLMPRLARAEGPSRKL